MGEARAAFPAMGSSAKSNLFHCRTGTSTPREGLPHDLVDLVKDLDASGSQHVVTLVAVVVDETLDSDVEVPVELSSALERDLPSQAAAFLDGGERRFPRIEQQGVLVLEVKEVSVRHLGRDKSLERDCEYKEHEDAGQSRQDDYTGPVNEQICQPNGLPHSLDLLVLALKFFLQLVRRKVAPSAPPRLLRAPPPRPEALLVLLRDALQLA
eukprot:CAMPEP_0170481254 /NCGR_PEP_ID=MMETSP0208-20121228/1769_1 /TAXON_ID=197538 /ORGANISM="Strombidium inclinatum, Strain S3" /LENGTH=210 /DNA_ID=CAMNT_0010753921 /DNA_START=3125 /DNA_END=3759 /DNA_ORIENTATION=-